MQHIDTTESSRPGFEKALFMADQMQVGAMLRKVWPYIPMTVDGMSGNILTFDHGEYWIPKQADVAIFLADSRVDQIKASGPVACAVTAQMLHAECVQKVMLENPGYLPWAFGVARLDMVRGKKAKHACNIVILREGWTADATVYLIDQWTDRLWKPDDSDHVYSITM